MGVRRLSSETWSTAHTETGNTYRNLPLTKRTKSLKLQPHATHIRVEITDDALLRVIDHAWHGALYTTGSHGISFRSTRLVHGIRASGAFGGQQARLLHVMACAHKEGASRRRCPKVPFGSR